jgi:uncharacterized protein YjbI with pentapeptide repeats
MRRVAFWFFFLLIGMACNNRKPEPVRSLFPGDPDTSGVPELIEYLDRHEVDSIYALESRLPGGRSRPKGYRALPQDEDDFSHRKLDEIYWTGEKVRNGDFRGVVMRSANCREVDFSRSDFRAADIRWSNLGAARIDSADFSQSRLFHVNVNDAQLNHSLFRGANMFGMEGHRAEMRYCDFSGALMKDTEFIGADLTGSVAVKTRLFRAVLKSAKIDSCDFSYADFTGASLEESSFRHSRLWGTSFRGSHLQEASFRGADLKGCDFFGASLRNTDFNGAINVPGEVLRYIGEDGMATGIWQDAN